MCCIWMADEELSNRSLQPFERCQPQSFATWKKKRGGGIIFFIDKAMNSMPDFEV